MACSCFSAERLFLYVNLAFAMYAGSLLLTAARLMWDPTTYTWFRFMCESQYRVTTGYVFSAGLALLALVALAADAVYPRARRNLLLYLCGMSALVVSEVAYGAWMGVSMLAWWRTSPKAELARKGMDMLHDLKPVLLTLERHQDIAKEVYAMIEETEREAPNNVYIIIVFLMFAMVLQVCGAVLAVRLQRGAGGAGVRPAAPPPHRPPPHDWRKKANLHMYTFIDKIF